MGARLEGLIAAAVGAVLTLAAFTGLFLWWWHSG